MSSSLFSSSPDPLRKTYPSAGFTGLSRISRVEGELRRSLFQRTNVVNMNSSKVVCECSDPRFKIESIGELFEASRKEIIQIRFLYNLLTRDFSSEGLLQDVLQTKARHQHAREQYESTKALHSLATNVFDHLYK